MFYLDFSKKEQDNFKQEFAYIEDYSLYYKLPEQNKEMDEKVQRVVEIDLNNGTAFKIEI